MKVTPIKKGHSLSNRLFWFPILRLIGKLQRKLDKIETRLTEGE